MKTFQNGETLAGERSKGEQRLPQKSLIRPSHLKTIFMTDRLAVARHDGHYACGMLNCAGKEADLP